MLLSDTFPVHTPGVRAGAVQGSAVCKWSYCPCHQGLCQFGVSLGIAGELSVAVCAAGTAMAGAVRCSLCGLWAPLLVAGLCSCLCWFLSALGMLAMASFLEVTGM